MSETATHDPAATIRADLELTLDCLQSDGLWLEATDPIAYKEDLKAHAARRLAQLLDLY